MAKGRRKPGPRWLALYTLMFLCCAAALAAVLVRYGRTLVWDPDGVKQHYTVIGYVGRAVRDLLAGRGLRMMNFSLGQGMDVLVTCSYYGYTDPFSLLGAFFSGRGIETAYMLADFLRAYLAGAACGLYVRKAGVRDHWGAACAAMVYAFCGYFAWMFGRHPYFLNGALYLPLMLVGVERVLSERRWLMYTLVTALMLVVNFYFAYMNTVIAVVYIVVRLIARARARGLSGTARDGFALLGGYLLGAALSAAVFLPVARVYLSNSRMGVKAGYSGSPLHFGGRWYLDMFMDAFAPWQSPGNYLFMNYAPPALFGLMALWTLKGRVPRQVRIGLMLCLLAASVPMAGYAMNGGAYVSERWSYAMALFAALGCGLGLPALLKGRTPRQTAIAAIALIYALALAALCVKLGQRKQLVAPALIAAMALLLLAYGHGWVRGLDRARMRGLTAALLTVCCAVYTVIGYLPRGYGYITEQMKRGVYDEVAGRGAAHLIDDDGVYRTAQGAYDDANSMLLGYMGTSYYWSLVDGENSEYYRKLALPGQAATYHLNGLGGSTPMNAVAAVKYFVRPEGEDSVIPDGYAPSASLSLPGGKTAQVYENALALPLGYAFDAAMTEAEYDALPVEDRLRALTQRAIVAEDGKGAGIVPAAGLDGAAAEVPWTFAAQEGAEAGDGVLRGGKDARVTLAFDAPEDGETYLIIRGLELADLRRQADGSVAVESALGRCVANVPHPHSNFYFPKQDYAFCLGSGALSSCDFVFLEGNSYRYADIRVVSLPLSEYRAAAAARRAEGLTDVALGNDRLTGRIAVPGDRVLQVAVPYSDGWRAWVDGEEQAVFRCGGMYMGVALAAGEHIIEMRYATPGLRAGAIVSAAALALTAALALHGRRKRRGARA